MIYFKKNDSIEGKSFSLCFRKFINMTPTNDPILSKVVFNFAIKDFTKAVIRKELSSKKAIIRETSYLNKDDGIQGEIISGFSVKPIKPISNRKIIHRGSHRAGNIITKKFSFAKIDREWRALLLKKVIEAI